MCENPKFLSKVTQLFDHAIFYLVNNKLTSAQSKACLNISEDMLVLIFEVLFRSTTHANSNIKDIYGRHNETLKTQIGTKSLENIARLINKFITQSALNTSNAISLAKCTER